MLGNAQPRTGSVEKERESQKESEVLENLGLVFGLRDLIECHKFLGLYSFFRSSEAMGSLVRRALEWVPV